MTPVLSVTKIHYFHRTTFVCTVKMKTLPSEPTASPLSWSVFYREQNVSTAQSSWSESVDSQNCWVLRSWERFLLEAKTFTSHTSAVCVLSDDTLHLCITWPVFDVAQALVCSSVLDACEWFQHQAYDSVRASVCCLSWRRSRIRLECISQTSLTHLGYWICFFLSTTL